MAWTLADAVAYLKLNPQDACIQYIALALAKRAGEMEEVDRHIPQQARASNRTSDLLSIFAGAAAVQESLQLDAMAPDLRVTRKGVPPDPHKQQTCRCADLEGPTIASHPWAEMLGGRKPAVSNLSRLVPQDFFIVESRSVRKLLEALSGASTWQDYLLHQVQRTSVDLRVVERLQRQLVLDGPQMEQLMNSDISEICVAGSDLYVSEGSDITVFMRGSEQAVQQLLHDFEHLASQTEDQKSGVFQHAGISCYSVETDEREIYAFAANPSSGVHIRSNSKVALTHVIEAIISDTAQNLGRTDEFCYVRTLMPCDEAAEDVFIYFSDPFIRNLVGPKLRLTERRRKICHNNLKMIEHATLLYCAQEAKQPDSLEDLAARNCLLGRFNDGPLACPDGGTYALYTKGAVRHGTCSYHGTSAFMTPCIEIPLPTISMQEAEEYKAFLNDYNQYWRTFFDPIGIKLLIHDNRYRAETIVLPLIDNSIYTGLAAALGGTPQSLDKIAVHSESVFGTAVRWNKDNLMSKSEGVLGFISGGRKAGIEFVDALRRFISHGLGNQIGFHACDAPPTFSLDLPQLFGIAVSANTRQGGQAVPQLGGSLQIAALAASLQLPIYLACDIKNVAVVDEFLSDMHELYSKTGLRPFGGDHCQMEIGRERRAHVFTVSFGPVKFRLFVARIGDAVYAASQPQILDALWESSAVTSTPERSTTSAHAIMRISPANWKQMLPGAIVSWQENARQACHSNFGFLTAFARAQCSLNGGAVSVLPGDLLAAQMSRFGRSCPDHGIYSFNQHDSTVECSVHGSSLDPRQSGHIADPEYTIPPAEIKNATATLTFLEDGLRAEIVLERID